MGWLQQLGRSGRKGGRTAQRSTRARAREGEPNVSCWQRAHGQKTQVTVTEVGGRQVSESRGCCQKARGGTGQADVNSPRCRNACRERLCWGKWLELSDIVQRHRLGGKGRMQERRAAPNFRTTPRNSVVLPFPPLPLPPAREAPSHGRLSLASGRDDLLFTCNLRPTSSSPSATCLSSPFPSPPASTRLFPVALWSRVVRDRHCTFFLSPLCPPDAPSVTHHGASAP